MVSLYFNVMSGMFFASTMIMVSIALVMAVIVTNIYAKKDTPQRCPRWCVRLASHFYPAHYLSTSLSVHDSEAHCEKHGRICPMPAIIERQSTPSLSARPDMSSLHPGVAEKGEVGTDGGCVGRLGCCGRLRRRGWSRRGGDSGDRASRVVPVSRAPSLSSSSSRGRQVSTTLETFDFRRSEVEWRMVAKFTDRVFFWLFLVMSLCVQVNLFLQMIPETRHAVV